MTGKSGGVIRSHLRFGHEPILSTYLVNHVDFVACHNKSYLDSYDILKDVKEGGSVLIACDWEYQELERNLTDKFKHDLAVKKLDSTQLLQQKLLLN